MVETRTTTLRDLLDAAAARGDAPAVLAADALGTFTPLGGAELERRALATSAALLRAGARRGEPVGLVGPNGPEWIVAYFGILCAGATPVPLDCQAAGADLARMLADCGARRVFATRQLVALLGAVGVANLAPTFLEDLAPGAEPPRGTTGDLPGLLPRLEPGDTAALFYTSGTTGAPKGVPLTHRNLLANVEALVATRLCGPADRVLVPLPLHHTYPFTCGLLGCLATGAALVMPAGVTGPQLVAAIRGTGVTMLLGVPRLFTALLTGIEAKARATPAGRRLFAPLLSLSTGLARSTGLRAGRLLFGRLHAEMGPTLRMLVSGGARLDADVAWRLEGLGWEVLSGYGLTETAPILTFNVRGGVRHESVGRPLPGVELRTEGDGASGEILARGPNVFAGYLGNPEATRLALTTDGWFRTGDVGFLDPDGFLHIVGRVKELIVLPGGKKLVPEEVEQAYAASPLVREAALLEHGGRLVALIVPDESGIRERGTTRIASLLREELEATALRLPAYQRIVDYRLCREPLPRTPLGKLQRFRLPALYDAQGAAARAAPRAPSTPEDRALIDSPRGRQVWAWLEERFAGKPLGLDASPQLDLEVDSLEWLALTLEIRDRFGVSLDEEAIARMLTVRDLVRAVLEGGSAETPDVPAAILAGAGTPGEVPAALRPLGFLLYSANRLLMRAAFRLRVEGLEHLPAGGPLLLAPNHASYLDPMALAAALPWGLLRRIHWAGWTGFMFRDWRWRLLSRATGVFPVDPDRDAAGAIAAGRSILGSGGVLTWFPEGRRSLTGEIGRFLPGVGVLLGESASPVVPVRISGSFDALPWNRRWPRLRPITVRFGPVTDTAGLAALGEGADPAERVSSGLQRSVTALSA